MSKSADGNGAAAKRELGAYGLEEFVVWWGLFKWGTIEAGTGHLPRQQTGYARRDTIAAGSGGLCA